MAPAVDIIEPYPIGFDGCYINNLYERSISNRVNHNKRSSHGKIARLDK